MRGAGKKVQRTERGPAPVPDVDMYSDEDLEGGFEDVEEDDEDGVGDENGEEDDDSGVGVGADADADVDVDVDSADNQAPEPSSSSRTASHFAIPSLEEIHGLRETSDLYMNNVFKLQLDEMRKHISPSKTHLPAMDSLLKRVHQCIMRMQDVPQTSVSKAIRVLEERYGHVHVPLPAHLPAEFKLAFVKPRTLNLVGSWLLKTVARRVGDMDVDMEVVMPSILFQDKDTQNMRYFARRSFYLAMLAGELQRHTKELGVHVSFLCIGGDERRACIVLTPHGDKSLEKLHAVVRIHVGHEPDVFSAQRLAPIRNNLRGAALGDEDASLAPTPIYNTCMAADSLRLAHFVYMHATSDMCAGYAEACQLLKIWATQRGFGALHVAQDGKHAGRRMVAGTDDARFVLSMVLAHLLHGEGKGSQTKLAPGLSSVQLFRGALEFLARHSFAQAVWMKAQPKFGLPQAGLPRESFDVFERVFVDPSGRVNLFAHWPTSAVDFLQQEAAQATRMLSDGDDHFADLFLVALDSPARRFDEVASLRLGKKAPTTPDALDAGSAVLWGIRRTLQVSRQALAQRARCVVLCRTPERTHKLEEAADVRTGAELGVCLDAEHAWHQVEHGPPPESPDAPAFRAFWGSMAELRRFKDGRVLESVVWPVATLAQRFALPKHILQYALAHHACAKHLKFASDALSGYTDVPPSLAQRSFSKDPAVHGFQLVQAAYDVLVRELRAMDELPLSVMGVAPTSAALRHMSVFVPGPLRIAELGHDVPDVMAHMPVHPLLITMESSGHWPDDLAAIQEMKVALYERMASVLTKRLHCAVARVVYDSDATRSEAIYDQAALHIVLPAGFAFSLRIHHDREQVLLHRLLRDKQVKARASDALRRYDTRFVHAPSHHAALQALHDRFPALGHTVRLVRRWFGAQLLSNHVRPEAMELLCVAVFLTNAHAPPATGLHGLVRVLALLARWDWRETPLLLPLENATRLAHQRKAALSDASAALPTESAPTFPAAQRADAEDHFRALRARDPACRHCTWVLATEMDIDSKAWTLHLPSAMVADGVQHLAQRSMSVIDRDVLALSKQMHALFAPAYDAYDFVIHVHAHVHMRYAEAIRADASAWLSPRTKKKRTFANLAGDVELRPSLYGSELRAGFDPVYEFVRMLEDVYGDTITLFYDEFGGTAIGGLWDAPACTPHAFKVRLAQSIKPKGEKVVLNRAAILAEIARLGHGLVDHIDTK